jgi:predicted N-formylglutamate amidohydrolase
LHEAYVALSGAASSRVFLTCEHASETFPPETPFFEEDAWLRGTHWAFDLGAEAIVQALSHALDAPAVLAAFSRLVCDPNRGENEHTLFRDTAEGRLVRLNAALTLAERKRRLDSYYRPFHRAVDAALSASQASVLLSIHTFTPVYEGAKRAMEIGVLFDEEEDLARDLAHALEGGGFVVALNEPYSGRDGLIYSAARHANAHGLRALELEVRQDLAVDADARARLVPLVAAFFASATMSAITKKHQGI